MTLVYVDNKRIGEVVDIAGKLGKVDYRNPRYFDGPEKCEGVYVHGDYPEIVKAYGDKAIKDATPTTEPEAKPSQHSYDYTVREVVEMAKEMSYEQIKVFVQGDDRKSVQRLL